MPFLILKSILFYRESDRNKGIQLLLKICNNIANNPTQIGKYGDLHFEKINKKLSKCKPAMDLLFLSGFTKSNNSKRLVWTNTQNNIMILEHIQNALKSINDNNNDTISATTSTAKTVSTQVLHFTLNQSAMDAQSQIITPH